MTATQWVQGDGNGFWAYDVALALFLDTLIAVAADHQPTEPWLHDAIEDWKVVKAVSDFGLRIPMWSTAQKDAVIGMIERACRTLAQRDVLTAADVERRGVFPRGATEVKTAPIVELGRAMAELLRGSLPSPPSGTAWFYGTESGRTTLPMRPP